jgi:hypothetical protein
VILVLSTRDERICCFLIEVVKSSGRAEGMGVEILPTGNQFKC